jgi:3-oxoacyl-[acyl-carrier-protein] synthase-3
VRFSHVKILSLGYHLPEERVSSAELEERLGEIYSRLSLSVGRLELMSGIRERRFFPPGTRPSEVAARAGSRALERCGIAREKIGLVIHASVCRDFLEPATASLVHRSLELSARCQVFDLSNACLGFANAMLVAAASIERRDIEAALVVAGEDGRALVEETIRMLTSEPGIGKRELKSAFASLTIGSGAVAAVLGHDSLAVLGSTLLGAVLRADSAQHELCSGDARGTGRPLMETDSEALLAAGTALARRTWSDFLSELGWSADAVDRVVTHQVGSAHRRALFETLGLDPARDFPTVAELGNIGSVSLPISFAIALEKGFIRPSQNVALLGIGSGIHCAMLGVRT